MASKPPAPRQGRQQVATTTVQQNIVRRTGPLPAPSDLFEYDQLLPGSADRIIAMAEREQAHRTNMEDMLQRADIRHRDEVVATQRSTASGAFRSDLVGQLLGAGVALACVGGAIYTATNGAHYLVSVALVGVPVAGIINAIRGICAKKAEPPSK